MLLALHWLLVYGFGYGIFRTLEYVLKHPEIFKDEPAQSHKIINCHKSA